MFQYAAARSLAERLGCALMVANYTPTARFGIVAHTLGFDRIPPHRELQLNGQLASTFRCGPTFVQGRLNELALRWLRKRWFPNIFTPQAKTIDGEEFEGFDERFFALESGTWLEGLFQSAAYFRGHEHAVRRWFRPSAETSQQVNRILKEWPKAPDQMAAVHIRRGDYASIRGPLSGNNSGWMLPLDYYLHALSRLPNGVGLAFFSDDPDWAAEQFRSLRPWVSRSNRPGVDLMAMARCRCIVTANSSFSWWAAWLNQHPEKTVIAPEFHL